MSMDLSSLGSADVGENLPDLLHGVADMVKAKGKLAKLGIGGSPLGYDPKKHLDETLQHLGLGGAPEQAQPAAAAAPSGVQAGVAGVGAGASGGVNMDHLQEVIQHLRSMGSGAAGGVAGMGVGIGKIPIEAGMPAPTTTLGSAGGVGQGQPPFSAGSGGLPPGAFNAQTGAQYNPPTPVTAPPVTTPPDPNAGVTKPGDLKFNFKFDPAGPKPPAAIPTDFMGEWQKLNEQAQTMQGDYDKLAKTAEKAMHGVFYYTDPKTGKEMMYEPPKPVEMQKEIGGKKHSFADWASLGIALLAATAGGKNGQAFAAGMLQGWFGGKAKLADEDTAQNDKEFANAQQARASQAEGYFKMLGLKDNDIKNLYAHMDRTMQMQLRSDDQKARLGEQKVRDDEKARSDAFTAVNASKGKYQAALKGMNLEDAKLQAAGWRAAETGLPENQRTAPTDSQVEASVKSATASFHDRQGSTLQKGYLGLAQSAPDAKTASMELKEALKYMDPKSDEYQQWSQMASDLASGKHPWPKDQNFQMKVARAHLSTANMELMALGQRAAKGTWSEQDDADWANAQNEQQRALGDIDAIAQGGTGTSTVGSDGADTIPTNVGGKNIDITLPPGSADPLAHGRGGMHRPQVGPSKQQQAEIEGQKQLKVKAVNELREWRSHEKTFGLDRDKYNKMVDRAETRAAASVPYMENLAANEAAIFTAKKQAVKDLRADLKSEYDSKLSDLQEQAGVKKDGTPKAWNWYGPKPSIKPVAQPQAKNVYDRAKKLIQQYETAGRTSEAKKIKANFEKMTGWGYDQPWSK